MSVAAGVPSLFDQLPVASGARSTLDALIVRTWSDVRFRGVAQCPVCGGEMTRHGRDGGGAAGIVASCASCGTELE